MDLRPKIAADIVDAVLHELRLRDESDMLGISREHLIKLATSKITSHSLKLPKGDDYGTSDPACVEQFLEQFLEKYPKLRQRVADTQAKALEIWPDADLVLELNNDPEGCHTCREGQSLHLNILRHQGYIPNDPKSDAFDEWWLEYAYPDNRDPVFGLFLALPGFAQ